MIRHFSNHSAPAPPSFYRFIEWADDGGYYAPIGIASLIRAPLHLAYLAGKTCAAIRMYADWIEQWYEDGRFS